MMGWSTALYLPLPHTLLPSRSLPPPPSLSFSRLSLRPARLAVRAADSDAAGSDADGSDPPVEVLDADVKPPRTRGVKMGGAVMEILQKQAIDESLSVRPIPDIRAGDIVDIIWAVPTKRRRVMTFKGIVTSKQNAGIHTTIRILRFISGNKVEITFPIYSPRVKEITVVSHRKVRRAKLYYLKEKLPRYYTFK